MHDTHAKLALAVYQGAAEKDEVARAKAISIEAAELKKEAHELCEQGELLKAIVKLYESLGLQPTNEEALAMLVTAEKCVEEEDYDL